MIRARGLFATAVSVAVMTLFVLVSPANATDFVKENTCTTQYPPVGPVKFTFRFTGTVYYNSDGTTDQVFRLGFKVWGAHTGGESDAAYTVRQNGAAILSGHTPDNLGADEFRTIDVSANIATSAVGQVDFRAAFDISGPDPHCDTSVTW